MNQRGILPFPLHLRSYIGSRYLLKLTLCEHTCSGALEGTLQGTWSLGSGRGISTRNLEEEPRPPRMHERGHQKIRAGLRGEYEKALIPLWWTKGWVREIPPYVLLVDCPQYVRTCVCPSGGGPGGEENASPYYVLAAQWCSPPHSEGSEGANVLVLQVGIFQYNNVLVPMVRRVARMRRHLTSIRITYRYRELYVVYRKSAERKPNRMQFRRLDASQQFPCTSSW